MFSAKRSRLAKFTSVKTAITIAKPASTELRLNITPKKKARTTNTLMRFAGCVTGKSKTTNPKMGSAAIATIQTT